MRLKMKALLSIVTALAALLLTACSSGAPATDGAVTTVPTTAQTSEETTTEESQETAALTEATETTAEETSEIQQTAATGAQKSTTEKKTDAQETTKATTNRPASTAPATTKQQTTKQPTTKQTTTTVRQTAAPTTAKPTAKPTASQGDFRQEILALVNQERAKEGLAALTLDETVCQAAQIRAKEIIVNFSHTRPDGTPCFTALEEVGIPTARLACAENIAAGQRSPEVVMNNWMHSPGHRANILNPDVKKLGVGYAEGGDYGTNWVQIFTS